MFHHRLKSVSNIFHKKIYDQTNQQIVSVKEQYRNTSIIFNFVDFENSYVADNLFISNQIEIYRTQHLCIKS